MRNLKCMLADGQTYTFSTFTMLEQKVMQKQYIKFQELQEEMNKIIFMTNEDGSFKKDEIDEVIVRDNKNEKQKQRLNEIQEEMISFMVDILRKSLSRNHKEFIKTDNAETELQIREKLMDLVDMTDLKRLTEFTFTGTYSWKKESLIDLTKTDISEEESVK